MEDESLEAAQLRKVRVLIDKVIYIYRLCGAYFLALGHHTYISDLVISLIHINITAAFSYVYVYAYT